MNAVGFLYWVMCGAGGIVSMVYSSAARLHRMADFIASFLVEISVVTSMNVVVSKVLRGQAFRKVSVLVFLM